MRLRSNLDFYADSDISLCAVPWPNITGICDITLVSRFIVVGEAIPLLANKILVVPLQNTAAFILGHFQTLNLCLVQ